MKKLQILARASLLVTLFALHSFADDRYIVRVQPSKFDAVVRQHRLRVDKTLTDDGTYLVGLPWDTPISSAVSALKANTAVASVEKNNNVKLPELSGATKLGRRRSPRLFGGWPSIQMAGGPWTPYVNQPANSEVRLQDAQKKFGQGSWALQVAVIDTGIDVKHDVLRYVVNTQDAKSFVAGVPNATTDQETTPFVDQETTPFVDGAGTIVLRQETTPFVDQETTPFVDQETTPFVDGAYWGHGTMVAGLVHLAAPNVRILPLRAFKSDGTGSLESVIAAIEYAIKLGNVHIINMSFSAPETSPALNAVIAKAAAKGIIMVASLANDGSPAAVYPANIAPVIGVAGTTLDNKRASFSNYGPDADIGAPGVDIMSTYPRDKWGRSRYGIASGTSFATGYVTGTIALLQSANWWVTATDADKALADAAGKIWSPELKAGQLDIFKTVNLGKD